jgi:hypothetical protein
MNSFLDIVNQWVKFFADNLTNFKFAATNPWLWLCGAIISGWLYTRWGLRKLFWFLLTMGGAIFLRLKVYAYLGEITKSAEVDYGGMIVNSIFYVSLVIIVVYFFFIKTE